MFHNLDDVLINAKQQNQLDEVYNEIMNAASADDLEHIYYLDDTLAMSTLDEVKREIAQLYLEYK